MAQNSGTDSNDDGSKLVSGNAVFSNAASWARQGPGERLKSGCRAGLSARSAQRAAKRPDLADIHQVGPLFFLRSY
jgi:hypothetical protein